MRRGVFITVVGTLLAIGLVRIGHLLEGSAWPFGAKHPMQYTPAEAPPLESRDVPRLASLDQEYTRVVDAVLPSVVSVTSQRVLQAGPARSNPLDLLLGNRALRPQPPVEASLGSGVIVSREGHIITNHHVVQGMNEIEVQLSDDRTFRATLLGSDPNVDIAVLKIDATGLTPLPLGNSEDVRVGQMVFAIGNPFGLSETVTTGIVSAKGRRTEGDAAVEYLQTDAAVNRGNSGGPLINLRGEIVGINTAIYANNEDGNWLGISFAIPSNTARHALESVIKRGRIVRAYLGVMLGNLTPEFARQLGVESTQGAFVTDVVPDSPAALAGLAEGDIIRSVAGHPVKDAAALRFRLQSAEVGERLELGVLRKGTEEKITVELAEAPAKLNDLIRRVRPER